MLVLFTQQTVSPSTLFTWNSTWSSPFCFLRNPSKASANFPDNDTNISWFLVVWDWVHSTWMQKKWCAQDCKLSKPNWVLLCVHLSSSWWQHWLSQLASVPKYLTTQLQSSLQSNAAGECLTNFKHCVVYGFVFDFTMSKIFVQHKILRINPTLFHFLCKVSLQHSHQFCQTCVFSWESWLIKGIFVVFGAGSTRWFSLLKFNILMSTKVHQFISYHQTNMGINNWTSEAQTSQMQLSSLTVGQDSKSQSSTFTFSKQWWEWGWRWQWTQLDLWWGSCSLLYCLHQ